MSYLIGIDPGMNLKDRNTGLAVYNTKTKEIEHATSYFIEEAYFKILEYKEVSPIIVLEDPSLITNNYTAAKYGKTLPAKLKIANDAGRNQGAAILLFRMLTVAGFTVLRIAPNKRRQARKGNNKLIDLLSLYMPTKTSAKQFEILTGYTKQTNEHVRDAATLVWGKTIANIELLLKL